MSAQTFGPRKGLGPVSWRREVEAAPEGKSQPGSEGRGGRLVLKAETVGGKDTGKRERYASGVTTSELKL